MSQSTKPGAPGQPDEPGQEPQPAPRRGSGRPPSQAARQAILGTAYRILMEEGLGRLTMERVALEAGVGKPTVYRSWSNAQELAMAAFMAHPEADAPKSRPGSARALLKSHLRLVLSHFASNRGRQITLTMASADPDSELAKAFRNQVILKSMHTGRGFLEAALAAGEINRKIHLETTLDMLYGPIFFRLLLGHRNLSAEFANQLVDTIFDGILPS